MDRTVRERLGQRVVDEAVLLDEREAVEPPARYDDLEVIAGARPIEGGQILGVGKRLTQEHLETVARHLTT
jgi:hypothetical protein